MNIGYYLEKCRRVPPSHKAPHRRPGWNGSAPATADATNTFLNPSGVLRAHNPSNTERPVLIASAVRRIPIMIAN
ncbi:MAG: hypothetical protein JNM41_10540 [Flavipsychrobacter sp.]|nr:hypothetical protein [Flavipsychrobacter sp.]